MALRLYSAVLCLSLAAAAVNETADSDGSNDSSVADRLAAMVDKQVDIVQVYSEWWWRRSRVHRGAYAVCSLDECSGCTIIRGLSEIWRGSYGATAFTHNSTVLCLLHANVICTCINV